MKTKLTKMIMSSLAFAWALVCLGAAMALGTGTSATAGLAPDAQVCSVSTLQGLYVFDAHGWNIEGRRAVPKAILQGIQFNGDGTLASPFSTVSVNGVIARGGVPGRYMVNADCTGTVSFTVGVTYDTFVQPDGSKVRMMQTSGVGGTPSVFEGTATRVP